MTRPHASKPPKDDGFTVGPGMFVTLHYGVHDSDGEAVGGEDERISVVFGMGSLLPVVERAIDGRRQGETVRLELGAEDGYGARDPSKILEFERSEFPEDISPGDHFEVENEEGELLVVRILEVQGEGVVVDLNHPLAGQDLKLEIQVLTVRPATKDETELAVALATKAPEGDFDGLIAPERLLTPRCRR